MANINNLKPFTGVNDPRRQNGRKKGSKNLSTIVVELLNENLSFTEPISDEMKQYLQCSSTTYAKAIAKSMFIRAINGDVRAASWISNYADKVNTDDTSFFSSPTVLFEVVPDRPRQKGEEP